MAYDRRTFIKFCLTAEECKLQELLVGMREEAAIIKGRLEDLEVFLAHRPDLKAEELAAPEKPKRRRKAAPGDFDELEDAKNLVVRILHDATPEMATKIRAGLELNHGLSVATMESWSLKDAQNAMVIIRGLEMGLTHILDTSSPPF